MTRTPITARSRAIGRVMPMIPPFAEAYATWPDWPSMPAIDAVWTITPRSPFSSGSLPAMAAAARRDTLNVPTTLSSITRR